jgi:hypothetical protein
MKTFSAILAANTTPHNTHFELDICTASSKVPQKGGSQPPWGDDVDTVLIINIFPYSAISGIADNTDEYSTLYPATDSASASTESNGVLLVSAGIIITNNTQVGNRGITNHMSH